MTADEIVAAVFGGLVLIALIVFLFIAFRSAEKTEEKKRAFLEEISKYYRYRNKQFEEDNK